LFRTLAIAAVLLLAALALVAAPAYAQEAPGGTPPPGDTTPPATPPTSDPAPAPAPTPTPDPAPQPPADNQPPPTPDPSPGAGTGTPSGAADSGTTKQPARPSGDEFTTSTAPSGSSSPTSSTGNPGKDLTGSRASDTWLGQDTFIVGKTATKHNDGTTARRRFAGLFLLGASTQATRSEAKARRAHETAKVSAIGGGPPKPGDPLPSQNPFFNLLSGPSGIAAGLMLASMLAVLGAAFVLPQHRLRAFSTPTVTWRPLAYVPPIELPG
jgi:hypothetical protein